MTLRIVPLGSETALRSFAGKEEGAVPLGRTSGPNPPNWGNDSLFFWTRLVDFIFIVAIPGSFIVDEWSGVVATSIQFAIEFSITTWLRRRRRQWWERARGGSGEAVA